MLGNVMKLFAVFFIALFAPAFAQANGSPCGSSPGLQNASAERAIGRTARADLTARNVDRSFIERARENVAALVERFGLSREQVIKAYVFFICQELAARDTLPGTLSKALARLEDGLRERGIEPAAEPDTAGAAAKAKEEPEGAGEARSETAAEPDARRAETEAERKGRADEKATTETGEQPEGPAKTATNGKAERTRQTKPEPDGAARGAGATATAGEAGAPDAQSSDATKTAAEQTGDPDEIATTDAPASDAAETAVEASGTADAEPEADTAARDDAEETRQSDKSDSETAAIALSPAPFASTSSEEDRATELSRRTPEDRAAEVRDSAARKAVPGKGPSTTETPSSRERKKAADPSTSAKRAKRKTTTSSDDPQRTKKPGKSTIGQGTTSFAFKPPAETLAKPDTTTPETDAQRRAGSRETATEVGREQPCAQPETTPGRRAASPDPVPRAARRARPPETAPDALIRRPAPADERERETAIIAPPDDETGPPAGDDAPTEPSNRAEAMSDSQTDRQGAGGDSARTASPADAPEDTRATAEADAPEPRAGDATRADSEASPAGRPAETTTDTTAASPPAEQPQADDAAPAEPETAASARSGDSPCPERGMLGPDCLDADAAIERLSERPAEYNHPKQMIKGQATEISLVLRTDFTGEGVPEEVSKAFERLQGEVKQQRARIAAVMSARLRGKDFEIDPPGMQERTITWRSPVEWSWYVTPQAGGESKRLELQLYAHIVNPQGEMQPPVLIKTLDATIDVDVRTLDWLIEQARTFEPIYAVAAAIIGLFTALLTIWWRRGPTHSGGGEPPSGITATQARSERRLSDMSASEAAAAAAREGQDEGNEGGSPRNGRA
jgi:hypothetical protein